jgi:hypothetical protein
MNTCILINLITYSYVYQEIRWSSEGANTTCRIIDYQEIIFFAQQWLCQTWINDATCSVRTLR